ncbi:hypothetical protein [Phocaeicola plebeius]|uniref:hypothetical protein n=1 Tax=Phocaeicola plebeius TaxID=310297 RepID=UPI002069CDCD|nr:hypothetical protein [Phocaeicola plebeius]DAG08041.1 MAG TPA: hypothetical protein [Caudoviricetes sp.]
MATLEFYKRLNYDFSIYEEEESLRGLINEGFIGTEPLCINEFNYLELNAVRDVILCYLRPITKINKNESSYSLKHIVERILAKETNGVINYISNGTFILAMHSCEFHIWRTKGDKNCFFNVSDKSVRNLLEIESR